MSINKETVEHVAYLARIELSTEESSKLSKQLESIVDFIDTLKGLNVENINPTSHILPINNVLRDDVSVQSLPIDKALMNAPQPEGNFFGVPKVIE